MIPISVIVVTKNEERNLPACLKALGAFGDVWVVDSNSNDQTWDIAEAHGARVENFTWNGRYPKKRQWCLETLPLKYDRVFFVDADEIITRELCDEIAAMDWLAAGYFVSARFVFEGKVLRHGLRNNKLAVLDRNKIEFPIVDDLEIAGMGEIEGHYQPVLKAGSAGEALGQLRAPLMHCAYEDETHWLARHERYASWEAGMNAKAAWPQDPVALRQVLKTVFRALPFRGAAAFMQSYIFKLGLLDGLAGFRFACSRARYYRMISNASKVRVQARETSTAQPERL